MPPTLCFNTPAPDPILQLADTALFYLNFLADVTPLMCVLREHNKLHAASVPGGDFRATLTARTPLPISAYRNLLIEIAHFVKTVG